jgi:hypothetical protein
LFSLWGANGAEGANCGTFIEGGAGYTCRLDPYSWVTGRAYRLRIWAVGEDALGDWWGAWVRDTVTGVDSCVGKLRVPISWGWLRGDWSVSWTEYFGAWPKNCAKLPWAKAQFDPPRRRSRRHRRHHPRRPRPEHAAGPRHRLTRTRPPAAYGPRNAARATA